MGIFSIGPSGGRTTAGRAPLIEARKRLIERGLYLGFMEQSLKGTDNWFRVECTCGGNVCAVCTLGISPRAANWDSLAPAPRGLVLFLSCVTVSGACACVVCVVAHNPSSSSGTVHVTVH